MSNDYSSLKVVDLKKELKTRGLSTAGNKDELIERLNTYTQNLLGTGSDIDGFSESIVENDILEEDVLGEELDYEEDVLKKSSELVFSGSDLQADVSVDSNNSSLNVTVVAANNEKPLPQREEHGQKAEKKVHLIRNRSISLLSDSDLRENDKTEKNDVDKNGSQKEESSEKLSTKLDIALEDRLELRKRKFGVLREEDKKKARAARFGITTSPTGNNQDSVRSKPLTESVDILKNRAQRFGLTTTPVLDKNKTLEQLKNRAERFGAVVSPLLNKLTEEEKMQARKNRFLPTNDLSTEDKKKFRAQRFNLTT